MTDITDPDLLDIFIGRQSIDNIRVESGNIVFDVCVSNPDTGTEKKPDSRNIGQDDLEAIQDFFASTLQSRPFAKHLLQILWIREVKFAMSSLSDGEACDFVQSAFALYGVDIDEETVEDELLELVYGGYLQENNAGFSLTGKGKRAAEKMFEAMKMFAPAYVEPPSITVVGDGIPQFVNAIDAFLKKRESGGSRNRKSKYEKAVSHYLHELVRAVKLGEQTQEFAVKLNAMDVADALYRL